jgi:hypothetical protein
MSDFAKNKKYRIIRIIKFDIPFRKEGIPPWAELLPLEKGGREGFKKVVSNS